MSLNKILRKRVRRLPLKTRPDILLGPNVPKPMHGVVPREILGPTWWNETRRAAYASTHYRCLACGVYKFDAFCKQWLEGHELYDVDYEAGTWTYVETVPLCHYCHNYIHDGRLQAILDCRDITYAKYAAIIQYGDRVLAEAGLKRLTHKERENVLIEAMLDNRVASWSSWRLILKGKEYPPKFKTPQQWEKAFIKKRR